MKRSKRRFIAAVLSFALAFSMAGTDVLADGVLGKETPQEPAVSTVTEVPAEELPEALTDDQTAENDADLEERAEGDVLLYEGFESGLPSDWRVEYQTGRFKWMLGRGDSGDESYGAASGNRNMMTYDSEKTRGNTFLITPEIDVTKDQTLKVSFYYLRRRGIVLMDDLTLYYRVAHGSWQMLDGPDGGLKKTSDWTYYEHIMVSDVTGKIQFGFKALDNGGKGIAIDEVKVEETETHYKINTASVTGNGHLSLNKDIALCGDVIYVTAQPDDGYQLQALVATAVGNVRIPLTKIRENYYAFYMPNAHVTIDAYFEEASEVIEGYHLWNFEGENGTEGWTFEDADGDCHGWEQFINVEGQNGVLTHSGNGALYSESYSNELGFELYPDNYAYTPAIKVGKNAKISFWYSGMSNQYYDEKLQVCVSEYRTSLSMHPVTPDITPTGLQYQQYTVDLSAYEGHTVYVGFNHHNCSNQFMLLLDDVEYTCDMDDKTVTMVSAAAALDGKIGLVFNISVPEAVLQDEFAYILFQQNGAAQIKNLSEVVPEGNMCRVTYYMPIAHYRDTVNMSVYNGKGEKVFIKALNGTDYTANGINYSIKRYVDKLLASNEADAKTKNLVQAIDDYGTAAQIHFNHNSSGITLDRTRINAVTPDQISVYASQQSGSFPEGMSSVYLIASFDAANSLKLGCVFAGGEKPSKIKCYIDGKKAKFYSSSSNPYYVSVNNVPAVFLNHPHDIVFTDGTKTKTITMSVMTYVNAIAFNQSYSTSIKDMVKALFLYNQAAEAYFDTALKSPKGEDLMKRN
ncbi:MAG: choice-of-anchor J domain-containing protein [Lachnospiraceae bacterium]|nr:choice-of-anchor J domain-containing protein [Lachnospiraceae bacterium]